MITQTDIVNYCINDSNFDTSLITDEMILNAQERHFKPLVGEELYSQIVLDEATYSGLINGDTYTYCGYTYQFRGIKPMLVWFALGNSLPFIHEQIRNLGVRIGSDETSTAGNLEQMKTYCYQMARSYINGMNDYINRKSASVSIYDNSIQLKTKIIGDIIL